MICPKCRCPEITRAFERQEVVYMVEITCEHCKRHVRVIRSSVTEALEVAEAKFFYRRKSNRASDRAVCK